MSLDSTKILARAIADMSVEQSTVKQNMSGEDDTAQLLLGNSANALLVGTIVGTKYNYHPYSFIIDHAINSQLDNTNFILDLGYNSMDTDITRVMDLDTSVALLSSSVLDQSGYDRDGVYKILAYGYYPFDGNTNDSSTLGLNGTPYDVSLTTDHLGVSNNAYLFNSTTSAIDFGDVTTFDGLNNITISCWVKLNDTTTRNPLITKGSYYDGTSSFAVEYNASNSRINFSVSNSRYRWVTYPLNTTDFYHITCSYSSTASTMKIYVNGVEATGGADTGTFITIPNSAASYGFGFDKAGNYLKGVLSEVLVLPININSTDALNLYNVTRTHKINKPLVTKIDSSGTSITGYDFIGTNSNLTATYGTQIVTNTDMTAAYLTQTGNYSVYCEVMPYSNNATVQHIWVNVNSGSNRHSFGLNNNTFYYQIYGTSYTGRATTFTDVKDTVYKCLCINRGGTLSLYINGVDTSTSNNMYAGVTVTNFSVGFSGNTTNSSKPFTGVISRPIIFNRALSDEEAVNITTGSFDSEVVVNQTF